ncbi:MAG: hypothetical protein RLZZ59_448 [Pseudomonadota bacterium]|jgi:hypothetical protein
MYCISSNGSDSKHGRLEELGSNVYAWWVEEENISLIREALRPTGIILCI